MSDKVKKPLFRDIDASEDIDDLESTEIESLCMSCGNDGVTKLLLTKIPLFHEVVLMSFSCPHCHYSDSEIQPGGPIQDEGVRYTLKACKIEDLNRLMVKGDTAHVRIPHLDFEIPPNTQKGKVSTVESILRQAVDDIEKEQPARKLLHPDLAEKLDSFVLHLKKCLNLVEPFVIELDDPSGNSFVENKLAPDYDPNLSVVNYTRSFEQDQFLGLSAPAPEDVEDVEEGASEVFSFQTNCCLCHSPTETRMKTLDVPHFKEVIIMASVCDYCGYKSNEVKSGAGMSATGIRLALHITDITDLSRDILKSETCSLEIPELQLELQAGTLGGQFTTVEGILARIKEQLSTSHPFVVGDSSDSDSKMKIFNEDLQLVIDGKRLNVHFILDDPAGNSYIQNTNAPDDDPELTVENYERNFQQNEELGLNDMKTENY